MKHTPVALSLAAALVLCSSASAFAQQAPFAPPPPPGAQPGPYDAVPPPVQPTSPPAGVQAAPPAYPNAPNYAPQPPAVAPGQWVNTTEYGWIWVPADANTVLYSGVPYTYLYTPTNGWTWYVSPWGPGPFHRGDWVRHAWRSRAVRTWVAPPTVSVRLEPMRHVAQPHAYPARPENRNRNDARQNDDRRNDRR